MAIYLCSFRNISRSQGRSAVAAAAYRSGQKLTNRWDGTVHDYTRKGGIIHTAVLLPPNAPAAWANREALWNAVEASEQSSRCRLCRECVLALPRELPRAEQIALVEQYVRENFVSAGMCADLAIHDPIQTDARGRPVDAAGRPTDDPSQFQRSNPHAHILLTVRPLDRQGQWEAKAQVEYRLRRGREERCFTAAEAPAALAEGWEKQYRYRAKGAKLWLTPSEAAAKGLSPSDRLSRPPRTTLHGRENPTAAHWNSPQRIREWREHWAALVNEKLAALGRPERVDHRSYAERGDPRLPTQHLGPHPGGHLLALNRAAAEFNRSLADCQAAEAALAEKVAETGRALRASREQLADNRAQAAALERSAAALSRVTAQEEDAQQKALDTLALLASVTDAAAGAARAIQAQLAQLGLLHPGRRRELLGQLRQVGDKLEHQAAYLNGLLQQSGLPDQASVQRAQAETTRKRSALAQINRSLAALGAEAEELRRTVDGTLEQVPEPLLGQVRQAAGLSAPSQPQTIEKGGPIHGRIR